MSSVTIALAVPVTVANGGTGSTAFALPAGTPAGMTRILVSGNGTAALTGAAGANGVIGLWNDAGINLVGDTNTGAYIAFLGYDGTMAAPLTLPANHALGYIGFYGYGTGGYSATDRASIVAIATETWSATAQGARIEFATTASGGTTKSIQATIDSAVGLTLTQPLALTSGGTGSTTAAAACTALGAAPLASPALTGTPTAPTAAVATNTTQIATTAFVKAQNYLTTTLAASTYAPLASPIFTGDPRAPTPLTADNDTSIATTAFVKAQGYAPLANPTFTGAITFSGFTAASVLFAGTSGVLSQSAGLQYSSSSGTLSVGDGVLSGALVVSTTTSTVVSIEQFVTNANANYLATTYGTGRAQFFLRSADGTKAAPTATASGRILAQISGVGYDGAAFRAGFGAGVRISATESWTSSAQGSNVELFSIPNGSTSSQIGLHLSYSGNVGIGTASPQATLHIGATVATARIYNLFPNISNGEWAYIGDWGYAANVATYGTNKNGTGLTRNIQFVVGGTTQLDYGVTNSNAWTMAQAMKISSSTGATDNAVLNVDAVYVAQAAKFGGSLPVYIITADPAIGFNLYLTAGFNWAWGKGSTTQFGGMHQLNATTGAHVISSTTTGGAANATAALATLMTIAPGGTTIGAPTGGAKGAGTLNATAVYANNVLLTSDERYKADIEELPDCLNLVKAISPRSYRLQATAQRNWGFIAQDVGRVMQDAGLEFGGRVVDEGGESLSYSDMVAVLWKAVQELSAKLEARA